MVKKNPLHIIKHIKSMKQKQKRTRWKYTNDSIRQILIDFYVKSPAFNIMQDFWNSLQTFDDPEYNKKLERLFNENPQPLIQDWIFNNEETKKINFSAFVTNELVNKLAKSMENPMWASKWDLTQDSFANLNYRIRNTKWSLTEVKNKYNLSYPTLHNRLPLFFEIKTETKWKTHFKYLYPKRDVFMALLRYYTERKIYKNGKNIYLEIVDLFKDVDIK